MRNNSMIANAVGAALLFCVMAAAGPVYAQGKGGGSFRTLEGAELKKAYAALMASDEAWKALVKGASSMGYAPAGRWSNTAWGETAILARAGAPVTFVWRVFDLDKIGSPDGAALVELSDGTKTYRALEIASNRDPHTTVEYRVTGSAGRYSMVQAHSFWTCLQNALPTACGGTCGNALVGCVPAATFPFGGFSWSAYFKCLASDCGICAAEQALACLAMQ